MESIMMGLRPGLCQITFERQPGHIKMAAGLMEYTFIVSDSPRAADATPQSIFFFKRVKKNFMWILLVGYLPHTRNREPA